MVDDASSVAVFFASSDNTRDVFERVFPAFLRQWPDCPYQVYAGFNQPFHGARGFVPVYAPVSGWGCELRAQIAQVPVEHVLLFLDDFVLLRRVDTQKVQSLVRRVISLDLPYFGFRPLRRAAMPRVLHKCIRRDGDIEAMPDHHPYYSSLQVALWKRSHLLRCLEREANIWKFERIRPIGVVHHAICGAAPVRYRHVVEKGRWLPAAQPALRKAGVSVALGERKAWPRKYKLTHFLSLMKFEIIGYSAMRIREALASRRRRP